MRTHRYVKGILQYLRRADIILWLLLVAISTYSLLLLRSVSVANGTSYFRTQLMAVALGVAGAIVITFIDYVDICNFWYLIAGFSVFLMVYTLLFADAVVGSDGVNARAWISIGGRTFQSSELVKIAFMLTYAKHLDIVKKKGRLDEPFQLILLVCHAGVAFLLCHLQGDDGAGVVFLAMFLVMSLAAGVRLRYFGILALLAIVSMPFLWRFVLDEYQKKRFLAVYNIDNEAMQLDEVYQQYQGRISIGSGGLTGEGLFHGTRVANQNVPFQHSDFIFSVAGEELGFFGCALIIVLLFLFLVKILHVAHSARDDLGKYICYGFFGLIALQSVSNIGMCLAILPAMGVTLPFFSAGGSSAACLYFGFGLVQSVYMRRKESDGLRLKRKLPLRFGYKQMKEI